MKAKVKKGWEALEQKLKTKGLSKIEIEEAKISFYEGIELLTRLFLSSHVIKEKN